MSGIIKDIIIFFSQSYLAKLFQNFTSLNFKIAKSPQVLRLTTLGGIAIINTAFILSILYFNRINNEIEQIENSAKRIELQIKTKIEAYFRILDILQSLISDEHEDLIGLEYRELKKTYPEFNFLRVISSDGQSSVSGSIDKSVTDTTWHEVIWDNLDLEVKRNLENNELKYFHGLFRMYRNQSEFENDQLLTGSFVISKSFRKGIEISTIYLGFNIGAFNNFLRLSMENYNTGSYDYMVDNTGSLLAHPREYVIMGLNVQAEQVEAASDNNDIGKNPINTRDADWITGSDVLSIAFGNMINSRSSTVVYRNLKNQNRMTSFRLVDLRDIQGRKVGVVLGEGLDAVQVYLVKTFIDQSSSLDSFFWTIVGLFSFINSFWLLLISKLRRMYQDVLAVSVYIHPDSANRLGLLPIKMGQIHPQLIDDVITCLVAIRLDEYDDVDFSKLSNILIDVKDELKSRGWIITGSGLKHLTISRKFRQDETTFTWSPQNTNEHLKDIEEFNHLISFLSMINAKVFIVYNIGNLIIKQGRLGELNKARVRFEGSSIDSIYAIYYSLKPSFSDLSSSLIYANTLTTKFNVNMSNHVQNFNGESYSFLPI